MNELMEKMDNLLNELDHSSEVCEIKEIQNRILKDDELCSLLREYSSTYNEKIRNKILSSSLFQEYKEKEIDLNLLILSFNKRFMELSSKKRCRL